MMTEEQAFEILEHTGREMVTASPERRRELAVQQNAAIKALWRLRWLARDAAPHRPGPHAVS